jgi:2-polyprenyl-6-methoxyphenol hydroxylase-like FAD-dependent oxidoreductase
MDNPEAIVVGAGPTGLMVAAELALAGVDVRMLEQQAAPSGQTSHGGAVSSCGGLVVGPGGGFVVAGSGFEAAVQDPDQAVAELA